MSDFYKSYSKEEQEVQKQLGSYLLGISTAFKVRLHFVDLEKDSGLVCATLLPCCGFSWDKNLITRDLVNSIEKKIIKKLSYVNKVEWINIEHFFEEDK